jgi:hypothetical protein
VHPTGSTRGLLLPGVAIYNKQSDSLRQRSREACWLVLKTNLCSPVCLATNSAIDLNGGLMVYRILLLDEGGAWSLIQVKALIALYSQ